MAFPINPPREHFDRPAELQPGFGITVKDDGHIFGYLTLFNARLIGSGRKNTKPPRSKSDLAYANAYNTKCDNDEIVRTGVIAGDGGHHHRGGFKPTQEAYADASRKIARVVYGEDNHGVYFTGTLCSGVDDATVEHIRSSGISGHWERPSQNAGLELLGACLVNIPGFAQAAGHRIVASATFTPTGGLTIEQTVDTAKPADELEKFDRIHGAGSSIAAAASLLVPVSGVLAALGTPTVDGRQVNNVQWATLPMPLWYLDNQNCWGHEGAKIVGRIDDIVIDGALVRWTGVLEEGLEGSASAEAVANLGVLGISMDGKPSDESEVLYEYDEEGWPNKVTFEMYDIHGATLTSQPAFRETMGVMTGDDGLVDAVSPPPIDAADTDVSDDDETDSVAASAEPGYTTIEPPIVWR